MALVNETHLEHRGTVFTVRPFNGGSALAVTPGMMAGDGWCDIRWPEDEQIAEHAGRAVSYWYDDPQQGERYYTAA